MNTDSPQIRSFKDLRAWQEGHRLVLMIYDATKLFPKDEQFGLTNQIRRAAVSVTSNIAEGFGRFYFKDKLVFFYHSRGSLFEVKHFLEISFRMGYITDEEKNNLFIKLNNLSVKLNNFISSIGKQNAN